MGQNLSLDIVGGGPARLEKHNIIECKANQLNDKVQYAIASDRYFYIGYTSTVDTQYIIGTLPKSQQWKDKFKKWKTYYANINRTGVTEKDLIVKYKNNDLCTNRTGGKPDSTGYVYVLLGQCKAEVKN